MERRESVNAIKELAYRAPQGISFDPERYGEHLLDGLEQELTSFLSQLPEEVRDSYEKSYIEKYSEWLRALSRCMSTMITGASKFPVRRMEKMNNYEQSARKRLSDWADKVIKRCNRQHRLRGWEEVERLQNKVDSLTELQEKMKAVNKIVRNKKLSEVEQVDEIVALGIKEETANLILHPEYDFQQPGFATYQLSLNLAKIKDAQSRIDRLTAMLGQEDSEEEYEWGTLVWCYSEERVRFLFSEKPDRNTIAMLKKEAFKWSPSNSAWQRQITPACKHAVSRIIENLKGGEQ